MRIWGEILADLRAPLARDPAAVSAIEVALTYPGVHAVVAHRFIHRLELAGMPVVPRLLAALVRACTGVEIHPSARLGPGCFIDHGAGVVIGGTAVVGARATIYQGVTLGGTSLARERRHPRVGDDVTVGVGAAVLGAIEIGDGARVGAGSVVVRDVAPGATVVGVPAREATPREAPDAARPIVTMPDPNLRRIARLEARLAALEADLDRLAARLPGGPRP